MKSIVRLALASSFLFTAACGGASSSPIDGPVDPGASSGDPGSVAGDAGASSGDSGASTEPGPTGKPGPGAQVTLSLVGSTDPVPHLDDFASQTPIRQVVAVTGLWLLKSPTDPAPLKVADLGAGSVETDLVSGQVNDIATVALSSLPGGTYTVAKVGVAYVRYRIAARLHAGGVATDGRYDNTEALSQGAVIDGVPRDKGWFRSEFGIGDTAYASTESGGAPLPQLPAAGGMTLDSSGPTSFYVFPVNLTIDPNEKADQRVICQVNVDHSFRWQDQALPGYAADVFDTTPTAYETVMSFGASAFSLFLAPK
jgi:hypothetical protein